MEDKKETKKLEIDSKPVFWTRFVLWVVFSLVVPILFINYRYGLFKAVSEVQLSGWCILLGVIIFVFIFILIRYLLKARKYSYLKQILQGFCYLILPVGFVVYCLYASRNTIDQLIQVLCCCLLSWIIAIAVNPMPRWTYKQSQGEQENFINLILDKRENKK